MKPREVEIRSAIVAIARAELGLQDPDKYWEEVLSPSEFSAGAPKHWCGGFALWCVKQAGLAEGLMWRIGMGFCYRLPLTTHPERGDIVYFEKHQHHALVVSADGKTVASIDGNQEGGIVAERSRAQSLAAGFYSIAELIDAA